MQLRQIPNTDMTVSTICLGTMTFGTPVGKAKAVNMVHWAMNSGINFIDTANMYEGYTRHPGSAGGVAEETVGKALRDRRGQVVLATKLGNSVGPEPEDDGTSPAAIRKQLDKSLKRLTTDYIDIYYLHKPDIHNTPLAEIIGAVNEAITAGKVRYYGVSNYSAEQFAEVLNAADENNLLRPVIHQPPYSLLKRDAEEELLPLCDREGIAAAPYQVLQGGLLTGKYRRGQHVPPGSRKAESSWLGDMDDALFDKLEAIQQQADNKGRTMLAHAMLETLAKPAVVSLVLGCTRIEQLKMLIESITKEKGNDQINGK